MTKNKEEEKIIKDIRNYCRHKKDIRNLFRLEK